MVRSHWKPDGRSKNLARTRCERSKDVVRTENDLVNLKWFHFDHVLTTSFDFPGRSEVFMVFLWCDATLSYVNM